MLDIQTFGPQGGNIIYKALSHPFAVEGIKRLSKIFEGKKIAFYDPENMLSTFRGLYPHLQPYEIITHDSEKVGTKDNFGNIYQALIDFPQSQADYLFILSFDAEKRRQHVQSLCKDCTIFTLEEAKLPKEFLISKVRYLDKLNFATNFAFFREDAHFSTRLVTANYWANYGAIKPKYYFCLFNENGEKIAEWNEEIEAPNQAIIVDSADIRKRFDLPFFVGQLFIHVIGAQGHDVVKYALDTYGKGENQSLSVTHDANAWPAMRFATLPAGRCDEEVIFWLQNSHATAIPAGEICFNPMGIDDKRAIKEEIPPYATRAISLNKLFPEISWPAQFELHAGNHLVRPRYEIHQRGRTRIAHMNVQRAHLSSEPAIKNLSSSLGRGFILPFPILNPKDYKSFVQPNPMAETLQSLPVRVDIFNEEGTKLREHFLGNLPRSHCTALALHDLTNEAGHADLVYDFRDGGEADGWLHALMRYDHRHSGHSAETSFGAHIFNTLMTWRSEPQSYAGPPPGLSTRLFLKLGHKIEGVMCHSFCYLIYPASRIIGLESKTELYLYNQKGVNIGKASLSLPASGSKMIRTEEFFSEDLLNEAENGYILIRDTTCRLFGYHGISRPDGSFSLDHMFGF